MTKSIYNFFFLIVSQIIIIGQYFMWLYLSDHGTAIYYTKYRQLMIYYLWSRLWKKSWDNRVNIKSLFIL